MWTESAVISLSNIQTGKNDKTVFKTELCFLKSLNKSFQKVNKFLSPYNKPISFITTLSLMVSLFITSTVRQTVPLSPMVLKAVLKILFLTTTPILSLDYKH